MLISPLQLCIDYRTEGVDGISHFFLLLWSPLLCFVGAEMKPLYNLSVHVFCLQKSCMIESGQMCQNCERLKVTCFLEKHEIKEGMLLRLLRFRNNKKGRM